MTCAVAKWLIDMGIAALAQKIGERERREGAAGVSRLVRGGRADRKVAEDGVREFVRARIFRGKLHRIPGSDPHGIGMGRSCKDPPKRMGDIAALLEFLQGRSRHGGSL